MSDFKRCKIKDGWEGAGREGKVLGDNVDVKQYWTPILFDDEEDPTFHKTDGLLFKTERWI